MRGRNNETGKIDGKRTQASKGKPQKPAECKGESMARLIPVRYTVRREKSGQHKGQDSLILLDLPANYGNVTVWDTISGHAEGGMEWYMKRTEKTPMSDAQALAERYFRAYYSPAERELYRMAYCHRIPAKAWTKRVR